MIYILKVKNLNDGQLEWLESLLPPSRKAPSNKRQGKEKLATILEYFLVAYALKLDHFVDFSYTSSGKPYIDNYHFSLSHKEDIIALSTSESEVGVDIEKVQEVDQNLLNFVCSPAEVKMVKNAKDPALAFTTLYTKKEAALKKFGHPLSYPLKDILTADLVLKSYQFEDYIISVCT